MWDSVSGAWERNAEFVDEHIASATELLLDAAGVREGSAVLDIACGAGGAGMAAAARVGGSGRVLFADGAPGMAAAAARRAGGDERLDTVLCDLSAISAGDESFDAVICRHGLMFAEDHAAAVREAVRVLRPGCRYAAMTWGPRAANPWIGLVLDAASAEIGMPIPPPGVRGPFALDDPAVLRAALEAGGLEDVSVGEAPTPMRGESLEQWWEIVAQIAGPLAIVLAGMDERARDAIRDRALAAGAESARAVDGGIEFDGVVLIGSGRRPG